MISTTRINDALTRALNTRYALIELYVDASIRGVANRVYRSIKDVFTLYALEKALSNAVLFNFDDTDIETLIFKIREYIGILSYVSGIDYFKYKYPTVNCPIVIGSYIKPGDGQGNDTTEVTVIYNTTTVEPAEWFTQPLTPLITSDGQTILSPINFSVDNPNIDLDTVMLEVQGDDPKYTTNVNIDGWHMVGNVLYWHNFYDLKVGMQMKIRWREG